MQGSDDSEIYYMVLEAQAGSPEAANLLGNVEAPTSSPGGLRRFTLADLQDIERDAVHIESESNGVPSLEDLDRAMGELRIPPIPSDLDSDAPSEAEASAGGVEARVVEAWERNRGDEGWEFDPEGEWVDGNWECFDHSEGGDGY
jgi:hypothetical protein